jgi:hypothetical protein
VVGSPDQAPALRRAANNGPTSIIPTKTSPRSVIPAKTVHLPSSRRRPAHPPSSQRKPSTFRHPDENRPELHRPNEAGPPPSSQRKPGAIHIRHPGESRDPCASTPDPSARPPTQGDQETWSAALTRRPPSVERHTGPTSIIPTKTSPPSVIPTKTVHLPSSRRETARPSPSQRSPAHPPSSRRSRPDLRHPSENRDPSIRHPGESRDPCASALDPSARPPAHNRRGPADRLRESLQLVHQELTAASTLIQTTNPPRPTLHDKTATTNPPRPTSTTDPPRTLHNKPSAATRALTGSDSRSSEDPGHAPPCAPPWPAPPRWPVPPR